MTELLLQRAGKLIAIEIDRALAEILRERYSSRPAFSVIESDVLKVQLGDLVSTGYVLVGNVPYYITTPIIFHVLQEPLPKTAVFLIQREVADRIVAAPGSKQYGALSVNVQILTRPEILFTVPPGAFNPPPKVESAVIRLTPRRTDDVEGNGQGITQDDLRDFQNFVIAMFGMRRKQLQRILRILHPELNADQLLSNLDIDPTVRPETLSPEQFMKLFFAVSKRER